jgi:hypothetical protein
MMNMYLNLPIKYINFDIINININIYNNIDIINLTIILISYVYKIIDIYIYDG